MKRTLRQIMTYVLVIIIGLLCFNHPIYALETNRQNDDNILLDDQSNTVSIKDAEDLIIFAKRVNNGETFLNASLINDIDISEITWTGIGTTDMAYQGVFNGNGHVIENLNGTMGLFRENEGIIKNVYVKNSRISGEGGNIGAIVGRNVGKVVGCIASGEVIGTSWSIGGIVGWNNGGSISGCISFCEVIGATAGGLVGSNFSKGAKIACYYDGESSRVVGDTPYGTYDFIYCKHKTGYKEYRGNNLVDIEEETVLSDINKSLYDNGNYFKLDLTDSAIKRDGSSFINDPVNLSGFHGENITNITLPEGWQWKETDTKLNINQLKYMAIFDTSSYDKDYYFTDVDGYNDVEKYVEKYLDVKVFKANSTINMITTIDKLYDGKPVNTPIIDIQGSTGETIFIWYQKKGNDWVKLSEAPVNVGSYKVIVSLKEDNCYNGEEAEMNFEIQKGIPSVTIPKNIMMKLGESLSSVKLPTGFTWKDDTHIVNNIGKRSFKAIFTPEDENYQTIEVDIPVMVNPIFTSLNNLPIIDAEDKTLMVGEMFQALKDVIATDIEDGNITNQITVIFNNVDTSKAGRYIVTYKVTDSQGASTLKTINVTVKDSETSQELDEENQRVQNIIKTDDYFQSLLWIGILFISMFGILNYYKTQK